jgi:hypothetical protein
MPSPAPTPDDAAKWKMVVSTDDAPSRWISGG